MLCVRGTSEKKPAYLMTQTNSVAEKLFEKQHQTVENIQNNSNVN